MCDKNEALGILSTVYDECSKVMPVSDAYLYGSYARGDFDSESDVDIILVSPLSRDRIWPIRRQVSKIANEISTRHDVSVSVCIRSKDQFLPQTVPYYRNVIREGIRYPQAQGETP